ncbi:DUF2141 domain-containing protein [Aquisediminimonas sediminicola]|uniref:DUF2141 domain-containing protein n=1 Tax=Alteraquisediminimonas sediminicola TaxID=2676787 RepID=UPI001C8E182D|nr:DUF2141 domain-containing protein [Aquisediminimonas sediminicola]
MENAYRVTLTAAFVAMAAVAPPATQAATDIASEPASARAVLDVQISALRSQKGVVRFCLTRDRQYFPDCSKDPAARHLNIAAGDAGNVRFGDLPYGRYALSLIHDENNNAKLDTRLGIPFEGFGFSNNPVILFGPPSFRAASFLIDSATPHQAINIKYMF